MKVFYKIRLYYKLIKRKFMVVNTFCKECGRDVHDFKAPDWVWNEIEKGIRYGNVLCYDCFCRKCEEKGLPSVWQLKEV